MPACEAKCVDDHRLDSLANGDFSLKERAERIFYEITTYFPNAGIKETAILKKSLESDNWTIGDLGVVFSQFKKDIEYWSWRTDLTEASKNHVAFAFAYLVAVRCIGKERAYEIVKNAPQGYVQVELLHQLFDDFS